MSARDSEEEALVRVALRPAPGTFQALDTLMALMDVLAVDDAPSPIRCAQMTRGLAAVLPADIVDALVVGARSPADIARRFFRLRELVALADELRRPRSD
jgi:hypothetical protein